MLEPIHCPRKSAVRSVPLMNEELPGGLCAAVGCGDGEGQWSERRSKLVTRIAVALLPAHIYA
jgi:hypothetical protein